MLGKKAGLIFILVLTISLFGCKSDDVNSSNSDQATSSSTHSAITEEAVTVTSDGITTDKAVDEDVDDEVVAKKVESEDKKDSTKSKTDSSSQTKKEESTKKKSKNSSDKISVTVSIDCKTLFAKDPNLAAKVSNNGIILEKKKITVKKNTTVFEALKKTGISFAGTNYISSINGLSEKDGGKLSGWMYLINGEVPMEGCHEKKLTGGENIQWRYTCSSGNDL